MFGRIEFVPLFVISVIAVISLITDLWKRKIYNWLTFSGMFTGLVYSLLNSGLSGFLTSLAGLGLGFGLYAWMFVLGMMGGGDVKFLMAIGAWGSPLLVMDVGILSVFLGALLAVAQLAFHGKLLGFIQRITLFLKGIGLTIDKENKIPFGVALAVASLWVIWANPFEGFLLEYRLWQNWFSR